MQIIERMLKQLTVDYGKDKMDLRKRQDPDSNRWKSKF
jgi:hypothetical protein